MSSILVKCPECGKRALDYKSGKWRGEAQKKFTGKITQEDLDERRRIEWESSTWVLMEV